VWPNGLVHGRGKCNFEVLEKPWYWDKELQLKPEELRNEACLSKGKYGPTVWHIDARNGTRNTEVLENEGFG
jgi:hypothetical protein